MVNPLIIERIVTDIKSNVNDLREASDITWEVYQQDKRARRFVERTLQITIEACIDAAQHIISEEGWREPESYRDAFNILVENGILQSEDLPKFEKMVSFRNLIVHYYERIDDTIVFSVF
ncbi:MAG TPA: DUF86 domain-containing protein [Thermodesulfovibrionia bacterium]|nr:DUF86 domain-containing protein [Thermodesulfovibrionia bacterium]